MNQHDYSSIFCSLNEAVEILARNRSSDPAFIAAYDTLKQSRAMLVKALNKTAESTTSPSDQELVAA